jgi:hypothetical protein
MIKRDYENVLRDTITGLALCHNVKPTLQNGSKIYQVLLLK